MSDKNGELKLKEFNLQTMADHAIIVMVAKRGSGKSVLCKDIIYHKRSIPGGIIIAPTDKLNRDYSAFFPDSYIHYSYDPTIIGKLFQRQEIMKEKSEEKAKEGKKIVPDAFLIMDDCLSSAADWKKDQFIKEMFMNGRHYKLTFILTMQYSLGITPDLRTNIDYVFLFYDNNISNRRKLFEHYAGIFPSYDLFSQTLDKCTENYGCMVINNKSRSSKIEDVVFWYRAKDRTNEKFSVGCSQFNVLHNKNYDENWRKKQRMFDMNSTKKKKGCLVNVELKSVSTSGKPQP